MSGEPEPFTPSQGVSCLMPTRGRLAQPLLAAAMFQAQTYPVKELLVVDDNADAELARRLDALGDPAIRVVRPGKRGSSVGALRNLALAEARHPLVATWDDDDLYDPNRLLAQVQSMSGSGAAMCLLSRLWVWWPHEGRLALSKERAWEPSLVCERRQVGAYPDLDFEEDRRVVEAMQARLPSFVVNRPALYLYVVHGDNTCRQAHFERIWEEAGRRFSGADGEAVLQRLAARLPVAAYRRELPRLPLRRARLAVNLRIGGAPAATAPARREASAGPRFLFLQVNKRCNLRCQHCDFWKLDDDDRPNYQPLPQKLGLIDELAALNPDARVVICGGESMLDLNDYYAMAGRTRAAGLRCLSVINGTRVRDARGAERMIREGPHEISVSLNSHRAELHDRTRGVTGAFAKAVRAVRLLVEARRRLHAGDTRIYVMGLVFDENYLELEAFYDFVLNDLGADKLKLNFLQPSFGHGDEADDFYAEHADVDALRLDAVLERCEARFGLGYNPLWRRQVAMYFRSLQGAGDLRRGWSSERMTAEHICNTYERNVMVDHYGYARLCFSQAFGGMALRSPGDLGRFWRSAGPIRAEMARCNRTCGISHSVRREASTLAPAFALAPRPAAPVQPPGNSLRSPVAT